MITGPTALLATLLLSAPGTSAPTSAPGSAPLVRRWQARHHEPAAFVRAISQTRDGLMWFGSAGGVTSFDGVRFSHFDRASAPALEGGGVNALLAGDDGSLLLGTDTGVYRHHDRSFVRLFAPDESGRESITALAHDPEGRLWVGTNLGVYLVAAAGSPARRVPYPEQATMRGPVFSLWTDEGGRVHVETAHDWYVSRDTTLVREGDVRSGMRATAALRNLWPAWGPDDVRRTLEADRHLRNMIFRGRELWAATYRRAVRVFPGGSEVVAIFPPDADAERLFVDDEGGVWVSFNGEGLVNYARSLVGTLDRDALPDFGAVFALAPTPGPMRSLTDGHRLAVFGHANRPAATVLATPTFTARALLAAGDGTLWLGSFDRTLVHHRNADFVSFDFPPAVASRRVTAFAPGPDGAVWAGTEGGELMTVLPGAPPQLTAAIPTDRARCVAAETGCPETITSLARTPDGALWVATRQRGLWRLAPDARALTRVDAVAPDESIDAVILAPDAGDEPALWLGTARGVLVVAGARTVRIGAREGLRQDNVFHMAWDRPRNLWLCGPRGVILLSRRELDALLAGRTAHVSPVVYTTADGLPSDECFREHEPALALAEDGRMWVATLRGVAVFDEVEAAPAPALRAVGIDEVEIDGAQVTPLAGVLGRFGPGRGDVTIRYTLPNFTAPQRIRFRHRLVGWHDDFTSPTDQRQAVFTNLAPGDYRFEVSAALPDAGRVSPVTALSFTLAPAFVDTLSFKLLVTMAVLALIALAQRLRSRQLRQRYEAVLDERTRIARDLHDTLAQVFSAVSLQVDVISTAPADATPERLRRLRAFVDQGRIATRAVVANLRGAPHPLATALDELRDVYPEGMIAVVVEGEPRALPPGIEAELLFIVQEAVSNAIEHGKAERVTIELRHGAGPDEPGFSIWVRDDGAGFSPVAGNAAAARGHHGLLGMQERARRAGGVLEIHSEPGVGSEIGVIIGALPNEPPASDHPQR